MLQRRWLFLVFIITCSIILSTNIWFYMLLDKFTQFLLPCSENLMLIWYDILNLENMSIKCLTAVCLLVVCSSWILTDPTSPPDFCLCRLSSLLIRINKEDGSVWANEFNQPKLIVVHPSVVAASSTFGFVCSSTESRVVSVGLTLFSFSLNKQWHF